MKVDIEDARSIAEDAWAEANSDDKLPRHHLRKVLSWVGAAPTPTHGHGGHVEKGPVILEEEENWRRGAQEPHSLKHGRIRVPTLPHTDF